MNAVSEGLSWFGLAFMGAAALLGFGLGLLPASRAMRPLYGIALATTTLIVLMTFVPQAYRASGLPALLVFVTTFAIGLLFARWGRGHEEVVDAGVELGTLALYGALWWQGIRFRSLMVPSSDLITVFFEMLHRLAPPVALVTIVIASRRGIGSAATRALLALLALGNGWWLAHHDPLPVPLEIGPWLSAAVTGLLLALAWEGRRGRGPGGG